MFNPVLGNCDENYTDCIIDDEHFTPSNVTDNEEIVNTDDDTTVSENVWTTDSSSEADTIPPEESPSGSSIATNSPTDVTFIPNTFLPEETPAECETCTQPIPSNRCPSTDTEDPSFLPNDLFCDSYYLCYHGRPFEMFCPRGFYWGQEKRKCISERESTCVDSTGVKAPECPLIGQFFIPHTERCNLFYYCENGIRSIQQCSAFKQWDVVEKTCKLDISAQCIKAIPRSQRAKYFVL